jgi:predicted transcriptional regulator
MPDPKLAELAKQLYQQTKEGKLNWQETDVEDEYQVTLAGFKIRFIYRLGSYVIRILNEQEIVIEEIRDTSLGGETIEDQHPYFAFQQMFSIIRKQAAGVDKALDTLLEKLKENQ